jgi:threonine synthase
MVKFGAIKLGEKIDVCVPTGNFGNIFAGYIAKLMGTPI